MSNLNDILGNGEFGRKPRVNSKRKGAAFERKIAKLLNERFDTTEFCRTPGSGAFGSTHALPQHLIVHGDLITPQNFKYVIECKNGYKVELEDLFRSKSPFYKFIDQARRDAKKVNRDWMVIYKKDRKKEIVVVSAQEALQAPFDSLDRYVLVKGKYYVYLLQDVLRLPDHYWFI